MFGAASQLPKWLTAMLPATFACGLLLCAATGARAQVDPPLDPSADLTVAKSGPPTAAANTDITYTITVTNLGTEDAVSAALSDPIPAGLTFVSLSTPAGWACDALTVGAGGTLSCTSA